METKLFRFLKQIGVLLILAASLTRAFADQQVNLSVKVIRATNGTRPSGGVADAAGFGTEVNHGNVVLANTGRGYRLMVVEFVDIQPSVPNGQPSDYWYSLDARANRAVFEAAARAAPTTWKWRSDAINFYVNNSASGQCSFPPNSFAISLGKTIGFGTVVHEIGHFFNLFHTHGGDYSSPYNAAPANGVWTAANIFDGDGLTETAKDNPNITNRDQLSQALFGHVYAAGTAAERATVDSAFENVMSYHNENVLLPAQMDNWVSNASGVRAFALSRRTWFVANGGNDANPGNTPASPFGTLTRGLAAAATSVGYQSDMITMQTGTYTAPAGNRIATPCLLSASGGIARIIHQ